jgi:two-component system, response regulator PdtaR
MSVRVLLVNNESVQRMELKEVLTKQGYLVIAEATHGFHVANLAREKQPDIVIMDIHTPDMDIITSMFTMMQERIAPVIVLTALHDVTFLDKARDAGVFSYLVKPVHEATLVAAVRIALARSNDRRTLEKKVQDLEEHLTTRKVVERAVGLLIEKYEIPHQQAFRKMQRLSMSRRISMREIAEGILAGRYGELGETD